MSIDAFVSDVVVNDDGSGFLELSERIDCNGKFHGPGQQILNFDESPSRVFYLIGCEVWGGSDFVMLGDCKIADRFGYTRIRFLDDDIIEIAFNEYSKRMKCNSWYVFVGEWSKPPA